MQRYPEYEHSFSLKTKLKTYKYARLQLKRTTHLTYRILLCPWHWLMNYTRIQLDRNINLMKTNNNTAQQANSEQCTESLISHKALQEWCNRGTTSTSGNIKYMKSQYTTYTKSANNFWIDLSYENTAQKKSRTTLCPNRIQYICVAAVVIWCNIFNEDRDTWRHKFFVRSVWRLMYCQNHKCNTRF